MSLNKAMLNELCQFIGFMANPLIRCIRRRVIYIFIFLLSLKSRKRSMGNVRVRLTYQ